MKKLLFSCMFLISGLLAQAQFPLNDNPGDTLGIWNITTFDEPSEYISIGSSESNIWQIGHPQKVYLIQPMRGIMQL